MARKLQTANDYLLQRVFGSGLSRGKNWFPLSSQLVGRKVSQFVKVKFFEIFPSEMSPIFGWKTENMFLASGLVHRIPKKFTLLPCLAFAVAYLNFLRQQMADFYRPMSSNILLTKSTTWMSTRRGETYSNTRSNTKEPKNRRS